MITIGFGGTYYTLWNIESERVDISLGAYYNKITATYYKNLSKDLDQAREKAGTDNFDESLRGKRRSFSYKTPTVLTPGIMTEREQLFRIILCNLRENTYEARKEALQRMLDLGYIIISSNGLYEIQGDVRYDDVWPHPQLGIEIRGTI
jgi:hypothetical protein